VFFNKAIIGKKYIQVILRQIFPELTEEERLYGWFQQDSATAHIARMSMQALTMFSGTELSAVVFGQHVHLNPCDFFLLGLFEGQSSQQ
jgi:hypothetical protein